MFGRPLSCCLTTLCWMAYGQRGKEEDRVSGAPKILIYSQTAADEYAGMVRAAGFPAVAAATPAEALVHISEAEILFGWRIPSELWRHAENLRWIQAAGAGVDDLLANPEIRPDVQITRVVDQFGGPIAEYVFTYLLHLLKPVERLRAQQRRHEWRPLPARDLVGLRMGVAGTGSIGRELIRRARAFEMSVIGLNHSGAEVPGVERVYRYDEWPQFVADLDVLVLTLPLTPATRHVVSEPILATMKDGAILVNVGRGALVDTKALLRHLQRGRLTAVLDVFEEEPLPADHPFWNLDNVWVTPHLSGPSQPRRVAEYFLANLRRYLAGQPLLGVVDRDRGY
jgi:phosphoglycerate dehydrogenase-like enzyme